MANYPLQTSRNPFGGAFRYDTPNDKQVLLNALKTPESGNFFWFGHGGINSIVGNPNKSSMDVFDVGDALQNKKHRTKPPQANKHPYRLVILNGCDTYDAGWSHAFGFEYSPNGTTNDVLAYIRQGRQPQAFVGWDAAIDVPDTLLGLSSGITHARYAEGLSYLFSAWMEGYALEECLRQYEVIMNSNGFSGHNSWKISGCSIYSRGVQ